MAYTEQLAYLMLGGGLAAFSGFVFVAFAAVYVYTALTMMLTANRLKVPNSWLAWIPVANLVLMAQMAKMHWWPVLLILVSWIPFIGYVASLVLVVYAFIWLWKICEARGRPGWWVLLLLIPVLGPIWGFVMWGILAWGK